MEFYILMIHSFIQLFFFLFLQDCISSFMMLGSGFFDVNCHVTWSLAGGAHDFTLEDPNPYISPTKP